MTKINFKTTITILIFVILFGINLGCSNNNKLVNENETVLYSFVCNLSGGVIRDGCNIVLSKHNYSWITIKGKMYYVMEEKGEWIRFRENPHIAQDGWIIKEWVCGVPEELPEYSQKNNGVLYSFSSKIHDSVIRTGPDYIKYEQIKSLIIEKGDILYVTGEKDGWIRFKIDSNSNDKEGWVFKKWVYDGIPNYYIIPISIPKSCGDSYDDCCGRCFNYYKATGYSTECYGRCFDSYSRCSK